MATLTGQSIASSYEQLLHVDRDGGGNGTTLVNIKDGDNGTTFALKIATNNIEVDGKTVLDQDSDAVALEIDTEATTADGLLFNTPAQTTGNVLNTGSANSLTTGGIAYFRSNASTTDTRNLVSIINDHASATGATALKIQQDSTGNALHISAGGNDVMKVDSNSRVSLSNNDNNADNTVFGKSAFNASSDNDSDRNLAIGGSAMGTGTVSGAQNNTAIGYQALTDITSADRNTAVGASVAPNITTGDRNTVIGADALGLSTTGLRNVAIGNLAMYTSPADVAVADCVAIGYYALGFATHTTGVNGSVAIGKESLLSVTSGLNVAVGFESGKTITTGTQNTLIGYHAGQDINEGGRNTAVGHTAFGGALDANGDESFDNTFIGFGSGAGAWVTAVSNKNTAVGAYTMQGAMNGSLNNVAMGYEALKAMTEGDSNIAIGYQAALSLTTGTGHTIIGRNAGDAITTETDCVLIGYNAGSSINSTDANGTTIVGRDAGENITEAQGVTLVGNRAGNAMNTGDHNTGMGYYALATGTGANNNTAFGFEAGRYLGDDGTSNHSSFNTIIGRSAMGGGDTSTPANNTAHLNIAIGHSVLGAGTTASLTASGNTCIGYASMNTATSAANNVSLGYGGLQTLTSGARNIAIGNLTLDALTTQSDNIAIGQSAQSAQSHVNSTRNIAIGQYAMENMNAWQTDNIAIGYEAMEGATTHADIDYNIAIGSYALDDIGNNGVGGCVAVGYNTLSAVNNANSYGAIAIGMSAGQAITEAQRITAVGYQALAAEDAGSYQTAVGYQALAQVNNDNGHNTALGQRAGYAITTGSANTLIGSGAEASANSGVNQTVIGQGATGETDNSVTLGNSSVTKLYLAPGNTSGQTIIFKDGDAEAGNIQYDHGAGANQLKLTVNERIHSRFYHNGNFQMENTGISTSSDLTGTSFNFAKTGGATSSANTFRAVFGKMNFNDADEEFGNLIGGDFTALVTTNNTSGGGDNIIALTSLGKLTAGNANNIFGNANYAEMTAGTIDQSVYGNYTNVDINGGSITGDIYGMYLNVDSEVNPNGVQEAMYVQMDGHADRFYRAFDSANSTARVLISSAGQIDAEGTINASQSLDYAEYFESKDGKEIAVGTTVKLDGNKIVVCSDGDTPLGVIRPKSGNQIVGGGQLFHWEKKYMLDDYGAEIWEDAVRVSWKEEISKDEYEKNIEDSTNGVHGGVLKAISETVKGEGEEEDSMVYYHKHKYWKDMMPSDVDLPKDAIESTMSRQKLNPDYDISKSYKSREERTEWHIVGLLGQIPITKGQPVASNWMKMKDVSDKVEMYFVK